MTKNTLKPVGTFEALDNDCDPLTAEFKYVAGFSRRFGMFGQIRETWKTSTYPDIVREIDKLNASGKSADQTRAQALQGMAEKIEPRLDFSDDMGDRSASIMAGNYIYNKEFVV